MMSCKTMGGLAWIALSLACSTTSDTTSARSSGSSSSGGSSSGGSGGSSSGGSSGSSGGGTAGGGGNAGSSGGVASPSPIARAQSWVDGFYGNPPLRGVNRYDHVSTPGAPDGYYVTWHDDPGAPLYSAVSDCSSFSDVLMTRSYGWLPSTTHSRPLAEDYYWAIRAGDHFQPIAKLADVAVGDLVAILYGTADSGGDSGHVAWVEVAPVTFAGAPAEPGLTQWATGIIDSSHGFHYASANDTQHQDPRYLGLLAGGANCSNDGECVKAFGANAVCNTWTLASSSPCAYTGVGRGRMRLYADGAGAIAGYTWSTNGGSSFYPRPGTAPMMGAPFTGRDVVVGRWKGP